MWSSTHFLILSVLVFEVKMVPLPNPDGSNSVLNNITQQVLTSNDIMERFPIHQIQAEPTDTTTSVNTVSGGADSIENGVHFQGDIIIEDAATFFADAVDRSALSKKRRLWPNDIVPFVISPSFNEKQNSIIYEAMKDFHTNTCLRFVARTDQADYINIVREDGCWSYWGRLGTGEQKLSLGTGCESKGIVLHELMHVIGFVHEHCRPDRDDFITVIWEAIKPDKKSNFEKLDWGMVKNLGIGYDYTSLMHYSANAFALDLSKPTIQLKDPNAKIGQRKGFSEKDIKKVNLLYECNGVEKPVHVVTSPVTTTTSLLNLKGVCKDDNIYCGLLVNTYKYQCRPFSWMAYNCRLTCKMCGWDS